MLSTLKLMTKNVVTVAEDASVLSAWSLMYEKKVRHLPVIDKDGVVVGMLSDRDVQRAMASDRDGGREEEIYLNPLKKVSEYMSAVTFSASPETPLTTIVEVMMNKKVSSVVIVNEETKCVGILTSNDIMRIFIQHLARDREILEKPMSFFMSNTLY